MGRRRNAKMLTNLKKEKSESSHCSSPIARNLSKSKLGAVIFGCKNHTMDECLRKKLFGLPSVHSSYVKNVSTGLPLFLFNYSDRRLHGIFEATSPGEMYIEKYAWTSQEGTEKTAYPAQVRVNVRKACQPLCEEEFKQLIAQNYYEKKHFWFELDKEQTCKLIKLFSFSPVPQSVPRPQSTSVIRPPLPSPVIAKADEMVDDNPLLEELVELNLQEVGQLDVASTVIGEEQKARPKKWSDLFKS